VTDIITRGVEDLDGDPARGLGIVERRSFAPWQLVLVAMAALVLGMIVGYSGKKTAKAASSTGIVDLNNLPSAHTATSLRQPTLGVQSITPRAAPTTSASSATTPTSATHPPSAAAVVLVPATTASGPRDIQSFATAGTWSIGWAFNCVASPAGTAPFTITIVPVDGGTGGVAVNETSRADQGVAHERSTVGRQALHIATDPACRWIITVTGIAG
jgi:hypothetical protein